jgi:hypothetical protein
MSLSNHPTNEPRRRHEPDEIATSCEDLTVERDVRHLLYREFPRGTLSYLTTFTPKTFDLKQICRQFGVGRYWVYTKRDASLVGKRRIVIKDAPVIRTRRSGSATAVGTALGRVLDQMPADLRRIQDKLEIVEARQRQLMHLMAKLTHHRQG